MPVPHLTARSKQAISSFFKTSRFRDEGLIVVLLAIALSSVFIFGNDRGRFYKADRYNRWFSSQSLTIAANLSPEHNFLMFNHQTLDDESTPAYLPYNRYPIGSYILTRLAILPFQNNSDFSVQIYAARILTLSLFSATVVLAYLALARITSSRWSALAAVMLAFSSFYVLNFNDMVGAVVPWLFGVMLVFHGMAIFVQEGRFRQLLVKTCIALLLGWHVYALLLVFIVLGIANELIRNRSASPSPRVYRLKRLAVTILKSRYLMLGMVALIFGASLLTFNLTNEYLALNRETPLAELPSSQSILDRTRIVTIDDSDHWLDAGLKRFLRRQLYRVGAMSIPYYLPGYENEIPPEQSYGYNRRLIVLGGVVFIASLAGLLFTRHKLLMATLILFGVAWGVIMANHIMINPYESLFLIGIPLALFSVCIDKLFRYRLIPVVALAATVVFVVSAQQISHVGHDAEQAKHQAELFEDFEAVRQIAKDEIIYMNIKDADLWQLSGAVRFLPHFFLAGNIVLFWYQQDLRHLADLVLESKLRSENGLLTPHNKHVFMYDRELHDAAVQKIYDDALSSGPVISSQFNVYLNRNNIFYVKEQCSDEDAQARFFLHVNPVDVDDLPEERRQFGFDNLSFDLADFNFYLPEDAMSDQNCAAWMQLPEYEVASFHTGQLILGETETLWDGRYDFLLAEQYRAIHDMSQTAELVIRSHFNVHLDQNSLFYIKEQCEAEDIEARFFLHIIPVNRNDLPEERQQFAFDNLDFDFANHGSIFDQKCAAQVQLPEYEIAGIRTGQFIPGESGLWSEWYEIQQAQQ